MCGLRRRLEQSVKLGLEDIGLLFLQGFLQLSNLRSCALESEGDMDFAVDLMVKGESEPYHGRWDLILLGCNLLSNCLVAQTKSKLKDALSFLNS